MKSAIILAAGSGTRVWPYGEVRPKALIPVANRPLVSYMIGDLLSLGVKKILLASTPRFGGDLRAAFEGVRQVEVFETGRTGGTADTLAAILESRDVEPGSGVFFGDTLVDAGDLERFITHDLETTSLGLLLASLETEDSRDWVGVELVDGIVKRFVGHPRGGVTHRVAGFRLPSDFLPTLQNCPAYFPSVEVGMMPPEERFLEAAAEIWRSNGGSIGAVTAAGPGLDVDKPWHILSANRAVAERLCGSLTANELGEGADIDPSASLSGPVRLGKGSRIGKNVIIRGRLVAGDGVVIDAGAILNGDAVIGDHSVVANACFIEGGSVIGGDCVVSHAAELDGVIFDGVYLYHYMEIYGIVGRNTDIGAATVCGSLRFDDGDTVHRVKGRRETPRHFANASFIGDYCRTGVNATIMPGRKTGPYSLIGPGVLLEEDLPARTGVRAKQEQVRFSWGPERYGW